jgi:hypothetical protein
MSKLSINNDMIRSQVPVSEDNPMLVCIHHATEGTHLAF